MPYSAEISRNNPSCFLFLIDQSYSMSDKFHGTERTLAQGVSDAINRLLQNLVIKCAKTEGVRNYYDVGVIGYGANVGPAFAGNIAGKEIVSISEIADNPARIEERSKKVDDGAGGLIDQKVKFPIWFDPTANEGTPMTQAFTMSHRIIDGWIQQHPDSFPPTVIHITDGESTDGDPTSAMNALAELQTSDGNVLVFNLHLSKKDLQPLSFPSNPEILPDQYAQMLFSSASLLTPFMRSVANSDYGIELAEGAKGFVLNAGIELIITALDIGTRPSNLR